jgi:hypothetical protein
MAKAWADPLDVALTKAHRLSEGLREARKFLRRDDCDGRACPDCRGVYGHFDNCGRQMALDAIRHALEEVPDA